MKHNYLDNYELVNGYALIDTDFSIITANEKMYKFLGAVRKAAISDAIHQVDIMILLMCLITCVLGKVKVWFCV